MTACADRYTQVSVADAASVSMDWTEIRPRKPLVWTKPVEEFTFHIDSAHQRSLDLELVGPNGKRSVPDVDLIAEDGRAFSLDARGFANEDMFFSTQKSLPVSSFRAIRIRNSFPIRISNLRWVEYDPKEAKR
jgi:hypothetical protein